MATIEAAARSQKSHLGDTLRTLSPWLAAFQWCGTTHNNTAANATGTSAHLLELPGQYGAGYHSAPPQHSGHVHIIKFDERIRIYETLRQPIRLRVCATDGRTYGYLLKYGEDMRQDQRIQQLLALMQQRLDGDVHCRAHAMRLETYAVVPISVYCGLLGWLEHCPAVQTLIERWLHRHRTPPPPSAVGADEAAAASGPAVQTPAATLRKLRREHEQFIKAASGERQASEYRRNEHYYGRAVVRYSRVQLINALRTIEYQLPQEMLRGALCDLATSAEAFFAMRTNYASSMAALSVAHWLLGIGDRHLSNVLLNVKTARVAGIDFGLSFGAGTRDQNVPELLPFRLTPQFVQAMNPLGLSGTLTMGMTHALRCWRNSSRLLESCMEVFVREPSIDWLESARAKAHAQAVGGAANEDGDSGGRGSGSSNGKSICCYSMQTSN